jgi:hypothetical protein
MRNLALVSVLALLLSAPSMARSGEISGEYLEARTCDVYTGPCFANGEIGASGREAVMAWRIDQGKWDGQELSGLGAALIIKSNDTLGFGGSFYVHPDKIRAVVILDSKANAEQKAALLRFVMDSAPKFVGDIVKVQDAPITLTNDHLSGRGIFTGGKLSKIETRALGKGDCVCSNETVIYPPLTKVENAHPAYTMNMTFAGEGLDRTWSTVNKRSAFLATFEK